MIIIGVDFHPEFQQIALLNTTTGETEEKRLAHPGEAEEFYRTLASAERETVRIGMEASGHARWFERLVAELQFELWTGDAAAICAKRVRKQKTDRQDAQPTPEPAAGKSTFRRSGCRAGRTAICGATVVASASHGASAHASHDPTASGGVERRIALQEKVVARAWTAAVGIVRAGSVGRAGGGAICWSCWIVSTRRLRN